MSKLWMKWFGGMVPRRGEQHLTDKRLEETGIFRRAPENPNFEIESGINATEAENCNLYSGELRPLKKPALAHTFCRPGDECWRVPIPDDPSVPPPEPPPEPPNCVPVVISIELDPPETLWEEQQAFVGWGQEMYISGGRTDGGSWAINPYGKDGVYVTEDNGETFTYKIIDGNFPRQTMRMYRTPTGRWQWTVYRDVSRDTILFFSDNLTGPYTYYSKGEQLTYNHSSVTRGEVTYFVDGENNSNDRFTKFTGWYPFGTSDTVVEKSTSTMPNTGSTSSWYQFIKGDYYYYTYSPQGAEGDSYAVFDLATLEPVDNFQAVLWNQRVVSQMDDHPDGAIYTVDGSNQTGAVVVSSFGVNGLVSVGTATFPTKHIGALPHGLDGQWYISALDDADRSKLMIHKGATNGGQVITIQLPREATSFTTRPIKKIGANTYVVAFLANINGTANCMVVLKFQMLI